MNRTMRVCLWGGGGGLGKRGKGDGGVGSGGLQTDRADSLRVRQTDIKTQNQNKKKIWTDLTNPGRQISSKQEKRKKERKKE
jgi:hypothetical protein